jgi:hypothetical protein
MTLPSRIDMTDDENRSLPAPMVAWERLRQGNQRFLSGQPRHPGQDGAKRAELSAGQNPFALNFGCSDSRVAAEIIFDQAWATCSSSEPPDTWSTPASWGRWSSAWRCCTSR